MQDSRSADGTNLPPLRLHVPEPRYRPGDEADFGDLEVLPAGVTPRPDERADAGTMRDMAYGLVRVLDDEGRATGPWDPKLAPDQLEKMLRAMALTRAFDERMFRAQRQGKTSFYMKCTGEEAVAIGAAFAMDRDDMCFPSYRQQGLLIARGWPLVNMMNQIYSNKGDKLQGKQLILDGISPNAIVFADRPVRAAGHALTAHVIEEWGANAPDSFAKDPPNATVSVLNKAKASVVDAVLTLRAPKLEGDKLTFEVDVLEGDLAGADGAVSVFMDIINLPSPRRTSHRSAWYAGAN